MAMSSVRCPVLGAHVTQVMDFEGNVTKIICGEYEALTGGLQIEEDRTRRWSAGTIAR